MMQRFSSYQEKSTNISTKNGKKDIKQTNMDYYKENNEMGQGELILRDNNVQEKILFDENNVVDYLKNRKKNELSIEDRLNSFLNRKKTMKLGTKKLAKKLGTKKGTKKLGIRKLGKKKGKRKPGTRKLGTRKLGTRKLGTRKPGTRKPGTRKLDKKKNKKL